jgi:acyl carrier protein
MTADVGRRVIEIAADVLGEAPGSIGNDTTPADIEAWDSLAQLNLVVALEDEFAIQLAPEDMDLMVSVGAIAALVSSRLG